MPYPSGVQYGITQSSISYCSPCLFADFSVSTASTDITGCSGPFLFVGAMLNGARNFQLGAFADKAQIQIPTPVNTPHLSNGVFWYMTSGYSFGFAATGSIDQNKADTGASNATSRLSWHLDNGIGGYRAGATVNIGYGDYFKAIYNCPGDSLKF